MKILKNKIKVQSIVSMNFYLWLMKKCCEWKRDKIIYLNRVKIEKLYSSKRWRQCAFLSEQKSVYRIFHDYRGSTNGLRLKLIPLSIWLAERKCYKLLHFIARDESSIWNNRFVQCYRVSVTLFLFLLSLKKIKSVL